MGGCRIDGHGVDEGINGGDDGDRDYDRMVLTVIGGDSDDAGDGDEVVEMLVLVAVLVIVDVML